MTHEHRTLKEHKNTEHAHLVDKFGRAARGGRGYAGSAGQPFRVDHSSLDNAWRYPHLHPTTTTCLFFNSFSSLGIEVGCSVYKNDRPPRCSSDRYRRAETRTLNGARGARSVSRARSGSAGAALLASFFTNKQALVFRSCGAIQAALVVPVAPSEGHSIRAAVDCASTCIKAGMHADVDVARKIVAIWIEKAMPLIFAAA